MHSIPPISVLSSQSVLSLHFLQELKWKPFFALSDYLENIYVILNQNFAIFPWKRWTPRIIYKVLLDVRFKTRLTRSADEGMEYPRMDGPGQATELIPRKACLCLQASAWTSGKGASQPQKHPRGLLWQTANHSPQSNITLLLSGSLDNVSKSNAF